MPRDGSNVYSKPSGTTAVSGTTIESAKFNLVIDDLVTDANTARAVSVGGTGATTASGARTNLGLGSMALQGQGGVNITGGTITGITDLAVADGGTGASSASAARTNLGLVIGTDVQAHGADLDAIEALASTGIAVRTAANTWAQRTITSADTSVTITNPGGVAGNIDLSVPAPPGSLTLLGTITTTSGSSQSLSSLNLTTYKALKFDINAVSLAVTSIGNLRIDDDQCSGPNNGPTNVFRGTIDLNLATGNWSANIASVSAGGSSQSEAWAGNSTYSTATTTVTFTTGTGGGILFDAGSILVYGVK